jgi:hypothetical protein
MDTLSLAGGWELFFLAHHQTEAEGFSRLWEKAIGDLPHADLGIVNRWCMRNSSRCYLVEDWLGRQNGHLGALNRAEGCLYFLPNPPGDVKITILHELGHCLVDELFYELRLVCRPVARLIEPIMCGVAAETLIETILCSWRWGRAVVE